MGCSCCHRSLFSSLLQPRHHNLRQLPFFLLLLRKARGVHHDRYQKRKQELVGVQSVAVGASKAALWDDVLLQKDDSFHPPFSVLPDELLTSFDCV